MLRRPLSRALLAWGLASGAAAASTVSYLHWLRAAEQEDSFVHAEGQAALAEQAVLRAVATVRAVHGMLGVWQGLAEDGVIAGKGAVEAHLRALARDPKLGILRIAMTDDTGRVIWTTSRGEVGAMLAEPERLVARAGDHVSRRLHPAAPEREAPSGAWGIEVTERHFGRDGRSRGYAVVSLDAQILARSLGDDGASAGQRIIVRRLPDGAMLLRSRDMDHHLARPAQPAHPALIASAAVPAGRLRYLAVADGREVHAAYRVPDGVPVVVQAVHDADQAMEAYRRTAAASLAGLCAAIAGGFAAALAWARGRRLRDALQAEATCDPLTGLLNRRALEARITGALAAAQGGSESLAVLLCDMDHFKRINDGHGHAAGDTVLRDVATALARRVRHGDLVCRWGGEELLVLLRSCPPRMAGARAEELREAVATLYLDRRGPVARVTMSVGVACIPAHGNDLLQAVRSADAALYAAKRAGRNRVAIAGPDSLVSST